MTYRAWTLAAVSLLCLPWPAAPMAAVPANRALDWIAVRPIRNEAEVQRLTRQVDVRGHYQDLALVLGDATDLAALQATYPKTSVIGGFASDERLYAVTLVPGEQLAPLPGLRVLEQSPTQAIVGLPASARIDPHDFVVNRSREPFHDGVIIVPTRRMSPARSSPRKAPRLALAPPVADPRVTAIVNSVRRANLETDVDHFSNTYSTRRSDQPDGVNAQNDLKARYEALGLTTILYDFDSNADDVIADLPGLLEPDKVVIVGAHYDSINGASAASRAPGADDNGSGTAAVLELARVFATSGQPFRYTLRFCSFASEEFGLLGSDAYSASLAAAGTQVVAMLNTDMNSYRLASDALDLDFVTNDTTGWLTDDLTLVSQLYVPTLPVVKGQLFGGTSDHKSFYYDGFPAVFYFEDIDHYSPYIHSANDTYGSSANDFQLAELIVQSVAAGLATYAEPADLTLDHAPLADTDDSWNPYAMLTTVTSHIATTPVACELHYDVGAGETAVSMFQTGTTDEFLAEIPAQPVSTVVSYWLIATDSAGYTERLPTTGGFTFQIGAKQRFYFDDFEGSSTWTNGGNNNDWQLGTPAGKSNDPAAAYSGSKCWGNDLGGSGFNGDYRANANCFILSPVINTLGRTHCHLRYARWLAVEDGTYDHAEIRVNSILQWTNPVGGGSDHLIDSNWVVHDVDVAATADNKAVVQVRIKMVSDGGLELGGWNVDDVELYSLVAGTEPAFWRDVGAISLAAGGTSQLTLNLGASFAGRSYVVLAGVSGTSPGFKLGKTHVDLNFDAITELGLELLPYLPGFLGQLDSAGRATATLELEPGIDPAYIGATLNLVGVTLGPSDTATPPIAIELAQ